MSEHERPADPARDGETRRYSLEDELAASQLPGHDINRDAGVYPREVVDRARAEAAAQVARNDVVRLAHPPHLAPDQAEAGRASVHQESPWDIEAKAHNRRLAERTAEYLNTGPAVLMPLRRFTLWTRRGLPPDSK